MKQPQILLLLTTLSSLLLSNTFCFIVCHRRSSTTPSKIRRMTMIDNNSEDTTSSDSEVEVIDPKMEIAWRYIKKPLLRIGKTGMTDSHGNSLRDLLSQHGAVKVKINTSKLGALEDVFAQLKTLAEKAGADEGVELLRVRPSDSTIMIGAAGLGEQIQDGAFPSKEALEKVARRKQWIAEKKAVAREAKEKAINKRLNR